MVAAEVRYERCGVAASRQRWCADTPLLGLALAGSATLPSFAYARGRRPLLIWLLPPTDAPMSPSSVE